MKKCILTSLLIALPALAIQAQETRDWTKADSAKSVEGKYISQDSSTVTVEIRGTSYTLKKSELSTEDQNYLKSVFQQENQPKKAQFKQHLEPKCKVGKWYSYLPSSYSSTGEKVPVCFIFSAAGKAKKLVDNFKPTANELGWVLIGIDAYSNTRVKGKGGAEAITNDCKIIYEKVLQEFNVDPEKVVFSGSSGGGWWSFRSSRTYAKDTAGIISQGGWMSNEYDYRYPRNMAVAMVNGEKDDGAIQFEKPDGDFLSKKYRATIKVFRFNGGHMPSPPKALVEAARWVHTTKGF
ncbi:hypothetical protein ACFPK9_09245 [Rubritalea spongiae]|uniref:SLA1 homology domain-containing protein n=1 Tax=Rubritalea spongiae TaxID=430797 RepID=A0ABW5E598_9BACT